MGKLCLALALSVMISLQGAFAQDNEYDDQGASDQAVIGQEAVTQESMGQENLSSHDQVRALAEEYAPQEEYVEKESAEEEYPQQEEMTSPQGEMTEPQEEEMMGAQEDFIEEEYPRENYENEQGDFQEEEMMMQDGGGMGPYSMGGMYPQEDYDPHGNFQEMYHPHHPGMMPPQHGMMMHRGGMGPHPMGGMYPRGGYDPQGNFRGMPHPGMMHQGHSAMMPPQHGMMMHRGGMGPRRMSGGMPPPQPRGMAGMMRGMQKMGSAMHQGPMVGQGMRAASQNPHSPQMRGGQHPAAHTGGGHKKGGKKHHGPNKAKQFFQKLGKGIENVAGKVVHIGEDLVEDAAQGVGNQLKSGQIPPIIP